MEVIDVSHLQVSAQVNETDRTNLKAGQSVEIRIDALPGEALSGRVQAVGGAMGREFWDDNTQHKFDVTVQLDSSDPLLRPGFTAKLNILGDHLSRAISIPAEAVFDHDGKKVVYCRRNHGFEMQEVKVRAMNEGRAILDGVFPGTDVALVNPETKPSRPKPEKSSNPGLGTTSN